MAASDFIPYDYKATRAAKHAAQAAREDKPQPAKPEPVWNKDTKRYESKSAGPIESQALAGGPKPPQSVVDHAKAFAAKQAANHGHTSAKQATASKATGGADNRNRDDHGKYA